MGKRLFGVELVDSFIFVFLDLYFFFFILFVVVGSYFEVSLCRVIFTFMYYFKFLCLLCYYFSMAFKVVVFYALIQLFFFYDNFYYLELLLLNFLIVVEDFIIYVYSNIFLFIVFKVIMLLEWSQASPPVLHIFTQLPLAVILE